MGRGRTDHRPGRFDGPQHRPAPAFRNPLLRTGFRPGAADRLRIGHSTTSDIPAQEIVLRHPVQRRTGFRRRSGSGKGRQKGGCGKSRRNLPHDQVGRYARRPRTTIRHDGIEALFAQRYQIDHDPAARTQAPGPLNKRTSRNRAGYEAGKPRTSRRTDCRPDFYGPPPNFGRVYTFKYRDRFPAYFNSRLRSHADPVNSYAPKHPRKKFRGKVEPIGR